MKRVIVTGATGFVGRHTVPLLVERGYEVHAVSSKPQCVKNQASVVWHCANLIDQNKVRELIEKVSPSHMLHFAWHVVPGKWASEKTVDNFLWVQSGMELIRCFMENGGEKVVVAGSCTEYDWNYGYCTEGLTPTEPSTFYGKCKNAFRVMFEEYSNEVGLNGVWARIFFLFGPHESPVRLVSSVCRSLLSNQPAKCTHGNQIRDFLLVEDVARAFVELLGSEVTGAVNVGSGNPVRLKDIVKKIATRLDRQELVQLGALPAPKNETRLVLANTERLESGLNWKPKYSLDESIDLTIEWWKKELNK